MSDEEGGKKESKKYKELSKDRPSISFSLGRAKLKRHSEFTTNKNKKMTASSPEPDEDNAIKKQDLPKKYEIIEAAKKEAREKKEQKIMKRKMKVAKMKFVKSKPQKEENGTEENKSKSKTSSVVDSDASFQHKIKVERVAPVEPSPVAPAPVTPVEKPVQLPPIELPVAERSADLVETLSKQERTDKPVHTEVPPATQPPQVQLFTSGSSNRSTSDGKALSYKQKLLRSNLADTRRDDSHLKLDALRNNRMGLKGGRGLNRGRGAKMIINKDGSTTMIPFQRDGQQVGGGVMAITGSKSTGDRTDSTSNKQKSVAGTRKHEHHSKKKDLAEWKEKLMKDLESINAQINEKAQDLT
eukprot:TRINITY_DN2659_c0_g2_i1.p1 TRINITY_DN2659_c0_g2~~TRINITY_DN2659_c0_g2_i1.p1  ORF type:complete len:356 (+),score=101.28 TRINITY_DN2659_c0_g2_i1:1037-2104(+)